MPLLITCCVFLLILTACRAPSNLPLIGSGAVTFKTATGLLQNVQKEVNDTVELGTMGITKAKQVASEGKVRVQNVQSGIQKITEGAGLIKKGVGK
ncbi:hypothetical protein HYR82_02965 [Candidatus Peregrinibacteria bacterium]|nr:hypothetical protein [Candidatus Peregrinibacteria bacterium]